MTEHGSESYRHAVDDLYRLQWFGARLGLETIQQLARQAGDPQQHLQFIHVAGTNGKGSTCAMLESIYRAAGFRTGLFTSPHLVSFRERIQVNREMISESEVVSLTAQLRPMLETFPKENHPTFFEAVTVMALLHFVQKKCEVVIWETGLGGRLDATNIVTPLASVITNIQYDHQKWLGETLGSIAAEKAGIIKPGVPVITGVDDPEARGVIESVARRREASMIAVSSFEEEAERVGGVSVSLPGKHQRRNAAIALAAVRVLQDRLPVSVEAVRAGLANVDWPGRLQTITRPDGRQILLDGAHNVAGATALAEYLRARCRPGEPALILGILEDKNFESMCRELAPIAGKIILVPVQTERTAHPERLLEPCRAANPEAAVRACNSLAEAISELHSERLLVISGSLYLVGEALELLGGASHATPGERGLNEWTPVRPQS